VGINKLQVGVLMGGKSIEREVSFNSGRTVCDHFDTTRYNVVPIFQTVNGDLFILPWKFLHRGKISDFEHRLITEAQQIKWDNLKKTVDFIFLAMHGRFAEDGTVQGFLEVLGIPYLGSKVFASALCMNKIVQKNILHSHGINTPKGIHLSAQQIKNFKKQKNSIFELLEKAGVHPPYVVKPHNEGSSMGVEIVTKKQCLSAALQRASNVTPGIEQAVLIEEKIEGMEFTCITITDYKTNTIVPLTPTEVVIEKHSDHFDYAQKYMPGRACEFTPPRCSNEKIKKIQETCVKVTNILGITTTSRTDGFVTPNGDIIIVDPNTLTGMAPSSFFFREAAHHGMSHSQLINHLIETELHQYGMLTKIIEQEKKASKENKMKQKMRVAVLMGGNTSEKEISLESGRNIVYKLSPQKYETVPLFVSNLFELYKIDNKQLVLNSTSEIQESVTAKQKINWHDLPSLADFVFIALHGGHGENGSVQGALEMLNLPYNGSSVLASALCADKFRTNQFLKQEGFDVPKALLVSRSEWENKQEKIQLITKKIGFPLIVKPHDDGCSTMVHKIEGEHNQLEKAIDQFFSKTPKSHILVEQCIQGMEITVGAIGNENITILPPSQTVANKDVLSIEEKFLPGAGENQTPAPLPPKSLLFIKKTIEQAYKKLGCAGYARIDSFYVKQGNTERIVILEVNTLPGLTPATCIFHQAAELGMRPMEFVDLIVQMGIEKHSHTLLTPNKNTDTINI